MYVAETVMRLEDWCVGLRIHGLVEEIVEHGERKCVLSDEAAGMIKEAFRSLRERYPRATEESVRIRALILVVCSRMGLVTKDALFSYVSVLSSVAEY
jgi:hypothetical protein